MELPRINETVKRGSSSLSASEKDFKHSGDYRRITSYAPPRPKRDGLRNRGDAVVVQVVPVVNAGIGQKVLAEGVPEKAGCLYRLPANPYRIQIFYDKATSFVYDADIGDDTWFSS